MIHVIGGGLAGLTASIELARTSQPVRLIEQHRQLGGRASTQAGTHGGQRYLLNQGPHALYQNGAARKTLESWGFAPSGGVPQLASEASMVYGGELHAFVRGAPSLVTCGFLSAREKLDAGQGLARLMTASLDSIEGITTAVWLDGAVSTAPARALLEALFRLSTYSADLRSQPARLAIEQVRLGGGGVMYVDRGWQSMIDRMAQYAQSLGVEIVTGQPFGPDDLKNIIGHTNDHGVVLAVSPQAVETLTGVSPGDLTPLRMACLDIALESMPPNAKMFGLGIDQPLYFSVHSNWAKLIDPTQESKPTESKSAASQPGATPAASPALVHVGKYMGDSGSDPARDRAELEAFADLLMPGWRDRVNHIRFLPDMTVAHMPENSGPRPDVDALATAFGSANLRIAGDWVGPEGMLADAAVASGLHAARSLLQSSRGDGSPDPSKESLHLQAVGTGRQTRP